MHAQIIHIFLIVVRWAGAKICSRFASAPVCSLKDWFGNYSCKVVQISTWKLKRKSCPDVFFCVSVWTTKIHWIWHYLDHFKFKSDTHSIHNNKAQSEQPTPCDISIKPKIQTKKEALHLAQGHSLWWYHVWTSHGDTGKKFVCFFIDWQKLF